MNVPREPLKRPRMKVKARPLPLPWTGITTPDCWLCSWAMHNGVREVKVRSEACTIHPAPVTAGGTEGGDGP